MSKHNAKIDNELLGEKSSKRARTLELSLSSLMLAACGGSEVAKNTWTVNLADWKQSGV